MYNTNLPDGADTCAARITIDAESKDEPCQRAFWPALLYARPWVFKDKGEEPHGRKPTGIAMASETEEPEGKKSAEKAEATDGKIATSPVGTDKSAAGPTTTIFPSTA